MGGLIIVIFNRSIKNNLFKWVPNFWKVSAVTCLYQQRGATAPEGRFTPFQSVQDFSRTKGFPVIPKRFLSEQ